MKIVVTRVVAVKGDPAGAEEEARHIKQVATLEKEDVGGEEPFGELWRGVLSKNVNLDYADDGEVEKAVAELEAARSSSAVRWARVKALAARFNLEIAIQDEADC